MNYNYLIVRVNSATITILADNRAGEPYCVEHGFSAFLHVVPENGAEFSLMFDTGRGTLLANAEYAGVDLREARYLVLSHGHYDHTDAFTDVLELVPDIVVCANRTVDIAHYSLTTGTIRDVSLSAKTRSALACLPQNQKVLFDEHIALSASGATAINRANTASLGAIKLAGNIPRQHPREAPSPLLFADHLGLIPDIVPDEIVLWFSTSSGLVILTSCCHAGFINTCDYVRKVSHMETIRAFIGGFHLNNEDPERLNAIRDYIIANRIPLVVPCHCCGDAEISWFSRELGEDIVQPGGAGRLYQF